MRRTTNRNGVKMRARILAVLLAALVVSGCARTQVTGTAVWPGMAGQRPAQSVPSPTASEPIAPVPSLPVPTTPAPTTPPPKVKPPKADPFASLSVKAKREFKGCLTRTVGPGTGGKCARLLQKKLKSAGFYRWGVSGSLNTAGVNALLNYQRSRGIRATGTTGTKTWVALATRAKAVPKVLPKKCTSTKGVVLCVDQAHRTLSWIKNGKVVKTFTVRLGGWNYYPKSKKWKVFATANGTWHVYDKQVNPKSKNYGSGAMPYSTMFYPDMYVHYSPVFRNVGYATSSHGCVNIRKLSDAVWIFRHTPIGATVHIFSPKASL